MATSNLSGLTPQQAAQLRARGVSAASQTNYGNDTSIAIASNNPIVLDNNAQVTVTNQRNRDPTFNAQSQNTILANYQSQSVTSKSNGSLTQSNGGIDARLASYGLQFNPATNHLNDYANYTYHIRWFMTSEKEAYENISESNPNSSGLTKTVIAESGVTAGFNIVDLTMHGNGSANHDERNMWTTVQFEMTVSEPLGLSLFDKIYFSSQEIGLLNHMICPYFIEVWFTGYDENGDIAADHLFYNLYRINITKVEASTTQVGTIYHFEMVADNGEGEKNQYSTPPAGLTIDCVTLADFFDNLQKGMNDQQRQLNNDGVQRVLYKFIYPDVWRNWKVRPADTDKHVSRNSEMDATSHWFTNGTTIKINRGQAIENIVNYAVYLCKEAQDWVTGANNSAPNGASLAEHAIIGYVTVYSSVKITGFDIVTRQYTREITYTLFKSESLKAYIDMQNALEAQKATTQQAKLSYLVSKNRLAKRYDYIYTGLNTEVITFDFKMNMTWAFTDPNWIQGNSYGQYATPALANTSSQDYQKAKGTLPVDKVPPTALQANNIDRQNAGTADVGSPQTSLTGGTQAAGQQLPTRVGGTNGPNTSSSSATAADNILRFNQSSGQLALTAAQAKNPAASQLATTVNNYINNRAAALATTYVEDTKINTNLINNPPLPLTVIFDPKPTTQNAQQNSDQTKTSADKDPQTYAAGTGFVGAIFGNIFSDSVAEFQQIEIGIRGDPWWIPLSNIYTNFVARQLTGNQGTGTPSNKQDQQAMLLGGDNCFLLEMRVGVVIDEETGLAKSDNQGADFFTGIYNVYEMVNSFKEGKFTQVLKATKDTLSQNPISSTNQKSTAVASGIVNAGAGAQGLR
jgi:hypothetical protein